MFPGRAPSRPCLSYLTQALTQADWLISRLGSISQCGVVSQMLSQTLLPRRTLNPELVAYPNLLNKMGRDLFYSSLTLNEKWVLRTPYSVYSFLSDQGNFM